MRQDKRLLREVFLEAAEIEDREERAAYLKEACGSDRDFRGRVEALLAVDTAKGPPRDSATPIAGPGEPSPGDRIGSYKLLQKIGEGGCGVVFMAEQEKPVRRRVALKVIKLGMDTRQVMARFEAERQALAMMDHPAIARVFHAGATETGRPYFAMELVRGRAVTEYCDRQNLSPCRRLELFMEICRAVQHAHQKGVVHRDLKPSNILVTVIDGRPLPKIIDFGIAKAIEGRLIEQTLFTADEQFLGTPAYMSPEQATLTADDVDTRSDIYSLGVLLYELLTGRTPFDTRALLESGLDEMCRTIRETEPPRPSTRLKSLAPGDLETAARLRRSDPPRLIHLVRGDLDWIVTRCLEKDRNRRYETANSLALDVRRHLDHRPITARPPGLLYLLRKSVRRHRVAFAAAAMVAGTLAGGLGLAAWQFVERSHALRRATIAEAKEGRLRRGAEIRAEALRRQSYASDMNMANRALNGNDLGRLRRLLDKHRPAGELPDLRGWEWRYLWRQGRGDATAQLCGRTSQIVSLSTSADGRWLATGAAHRGGLLLVNLDDPGTTIRLSDESRRVLAAFSPVDPLLAYTTVGLADSGRVQSTLRLWNSETGRPAGHRDLDSECVGLAFSADGKRLVTSTSRGAEGTITLWQIPDLHPVSRFPSRQFGFELAPEGFAVTSDLRLAAYAPDCRRIPKDRRSIRLVDLADGGDVVWEPKIESRIVTALAFSPDGERLAMAGGYDGGIEESAIRIWDVRERREIRRLTGHEAHVLSIRWTADGRRLISGSEDRTLAVWEVETGRRADTLHGHELGIWRVHLLPDGKTVISGCKDGTMVTWDISRPQPRFSPIGFPAPVKDWCFSEKGDSILTVDREGRVDRWHGDRFQQTETVFRFHPGAMEPGPHCLSEDGRKVVMTSKDGGCTVVDLADPVQRVELGPANDTVPARLYGSWVTRYRADRRSLSFWSRDSGERIFSGTSLPDLLNIEFNPAQDCFVQFSFYERLQVIDPRAGRVANHRLDFGEVEGAAFSPDGWHFALASHRGHVRVWDTRTWNEVATADGFLGERDGVTFSPDGRRMLACGGSLAEEAFRLFDTTGWQDVITLRCEGSHFHNSKFSPDGNTAGMNPVTGTLAVWRAPPWEEIEEEESRTGGWIGHRGE